jgi:hypothetical protein
MPRRAAISAVPAGQDDVASGAVPCCCGSRRGVAAADQVVVQVVARRVVERHGARALRLDPDVAVVDGVIAGHEAARAVEVAVGSDVDAVVVVAVGVVEGHGARPTRGDALFGIALGSVPRDEQRLPA